MREPCSSETTSCLSESLKRTKMDSSESAPKNGLHAHEFIVNEESEATLRNFKSELKRRNTHHKRGSMFRRGRRGTIFGPQHMTTESLKEDRLR